MTLTVRRTCDAFPTQYEITGLPGGMWAYLRFRGRRLSLNVAGAGRAMQHDETDLAQRVEYPFVAWDDDDHMGGNYMTHSEATGVLEMWLPPLVEQALIKAALTP